MTTTHRNKVIFLIAVIVLSFGILAPTIFGKDAMPERYPFKAMRLGLDLRGGSYLVLGVETEKAIESQLRAIGSSVRAELRREKVRSLRFRVIGTREIEFSLLGDASFEQLVAYIGKDFPELAQADVKRGGERVTARYRITDVKAKELEGSAVQQAIETIRNRVDQYGVSEPVIQRVGEKRIMVQLPDVTNLDFVKKTIGSVAQLEFRLVPNQAALDSGTVDTAKKKNRDGSFTTVEDEILMTGDAIQTANVDVNPQSNEISVSLRFKSSGAKLFERITGDNVGRQLAIVLDGVVQSAPVIRDKIGGGFANISGQFTTEEAHQLAIVLRSGALPAPLTFEEERTVGASLGADSISKGVNSMLIGCGIVMLFVVFYYRKAGALAVVCLGLNLLFLLTLLSLLGATLTLPGLAGLALTIGMAVDANIIIYERIKDELKNGVSPNMAALAGFDRAHWTILDSNITTFITGLILYGFGTGPIKGFAVTLCLGILTTVFCALFVSKLGFDVLKLKKSDGALSI